MSTPPLPILAISLGAYRILFRNFSAYIRLSWLPFLIIFAASTGMQFFYRGVGDLSEEANLALYLLGMLFEMSLWLLTVPVATGWTRMVLLNTEQQVRLAVGRVEAVYLLRYVCIALLALGSFALVAALFFVITEVISFDPDTISSDASDSEASGTSIAIMLAVVLVPAVAAAVLIISRFVVALPAAAVGDPSRLRDSFVLTKGRTWALFAILILTSFPDGLHSLAFGVGEFDMELGPTDGIFSAAWIAIQYYGISWLFFPVSVGALALAYRRLGGMSDQTSESAEPA